MKDKVFPVDISTLQERVYQEVRNALHQGRFVPGETVTIRGLAKALGTSAMPVREALQRLVAEKALEQTPNRNIRVAPFTPEIFSELTRIRITVEGLAVQRATMNATPALLERLREANASMRRAIAAADADTVLDANKNFHFEMYRAAAMPQLLEIITSLWLRSGPFIAMALRKVPGSDSIFTSGTVTHDRMIAAIEARAPDKVRFLLALDIRATARWFRNHSQEGEELRSAE